MILISSLTAKKLAIGSPSTNGQNSPEGKPLACVVVSIVSYISSN